MTKEERKEYMRNYRKEHKEQIKASVEKRNIRKFNDSLDHLETVGNEYHAHMKDGTTFVFVRPFDAKIV